MTDQTTETAPAAPSVDMLKQHVAAAEAALVALEGPLHAASNAHRAYLKAQIEGDPAPIEVAKVAHEVAKAAADAAVATHAPRAIDRAAQALLDAREALAEALKGV